VIVGTKELYHVELSPVTNADEEGQKPGEIAIHITPAAKCGGVAIPWSLVPPEELKKIDPKAAIRTDLATSAGTVFIAEGSSDVTVPIVPVDDALVEPDEHVYLAPQRFEDDAIVLKPKSGAIITLFDNEWRWVEKVGKWKLKPDNGPELINDGLAPRDEWDYSLLIRLDTNIIYARADSQYTAYPGGGTSISSQTAEIEFNCAPRTGLITMDNSSIIYGASKVGQAATYLKYRDVQKQESNPDIHTVSINIEERAGFEGTFTFQTSTGLVGFSKAQPYGEERILEKPLTLDCKKGNR
jgi:hypothetical protein